MILEEWIGKEAFGLGCEISTILAEFSVEDRKACLRRLLTAIRNWQAVKQEENRTGTLTKTKRKIQSE